MALHTASDVGAPHGRDRWFCLATMGNANKPQRARLPSRTKSEITITGGNGKDVAYARGQRAECISQMDKNTRSQTVERTEFSGGGEDVADPKLCRRLHGQAEIKPTEGRLNALGKF